MRFKIQKGVTGLSIIVYCFRYFRINTLIYRCVILVQPPEICFHFVSLPGCLSGPLAVWFCAIILFAIAGNEKPAAMNTGNLLHIAAPSNGMSENNYMDFYLFFKSKWKGMKWLELNRRDGWEL